MIILDVCFAWKENRTCYISRLKPYRKHLSRFCGLENPQLSILNAKTPTESFDHIHILNTTYPFPHLAFLQNRGQLPSLIQASIEKVAVYHNDTHVLLFCCKAGIISVVREVLLCGDTV